jgi:hypothetical protein
MPLDLQRAPKIPTDGGDPTSAPTKIEIESTPEGLTVTCYHRGAGGAGVKKYDFATPDEAMGFVAEKLGAEPSEGGGENLEDIGSDIGAELGGPGAPPPDMLGAGGPLPEPEEEISPAPKRGGPLPMPIK